MKLCIEFVNANANANANEWEYERARRHIIEENNETHEVYVCNSGDGKSVSLVWHQFLLGFFFSLLLVMCTRAFGCRKST